MTPIVHNMSKPVAIILGAGSGLGVSLCQTFSAAGYQVIGLNRSPVKNNNDYVLQQVDLSNKQDTGIAIEQILEEYGPPEVVIHNTAQLVIKPFLETSAEEFTQTWQSMTLSLINSLHFLLPAMVSTGKGSVIVSGATASQRGSKNFAAFASAKFALRGLTQSLAREFQPQGIHIAHVLLDGIIDTDASRAMHSLDPSRMLKPDEVAQQYKQLTEQPRSVWAHELDLRPSSEVF